MCIGYLHVEVTTVMLKAKSVAQLMYRHTLHLPVSRQHLSNGDGLEDNGEDYQNCYVLCTTVVHNDTHTQAYKQFLNMSVGFRFRFSFRVFVIPPYGSMGDT